MFNLKFPIFVLLCEVSITDLFMFVQFPDLFPFCNLVIARLSSSLSLHLGGTYKVYRIAWNGTKLKCKQVSNEDDFQWKTTKQIDPPFNYSKIQIMLIKPLGLEILVLWLTSTTSTHSLLWEILILDINQLY